MGKMRRKLKTANRPSAGKPGAGLAGLPPELMRRSDEGKLLQSWPGVEWMGLSMDMMADGRTTYSGNFRQFQAPAGNRSRHRIRRSTLLLRADRAGFRGKHTGRRPHDPRYRPEPSDALVAAGLPAFLGTDEMVAAFF